MKSVLFAIFFLSVLSLNAYGDSKSTNAPEVFFSQSQIPLDNALHSFTIQTIIIINEYSETNTISNAQKKTIESYLTALKDAPKELSYSSRVYSVLGSLARYGLISSKEYDAYVGARKEYYNKLNAPFREYIMDKIKNIQDLSYDDVKHIINPPNAYNEDSLGFDKEMAQKIERYYQEQFMHKDYINRNKYKKHWLEFLLGFRFYQCVQCDTECEIDDKASYKKEMALAERLFEPIYTDGTITISKITGRKLIEPEHIICFNSESDRSCSYDLKKPLRLKGTLKADTRYDRGDCEVLTRYDRNGYAVEIIEQFWFEPQEIQNIQLKPEDKQILFGILGGFYLRDDFDYIESRLLPQWFKEGIAGEVIFEAEITLDKFYYNRSACSIGDSADVRNVALLRQIQQTKYDKSAYRFLSLELGSKDSYINLRKSPNGEILTHIKLKDLKDIEIFGLPISQEDEASKWRKVLYFPPNKEEFKDAIVGYIHESQIAKGTYDY